MEPKQRKQTRDCFRMIFSRKRKHSKKKTGADDTDRDRIVSPPPGTSVGASDDVQSLPSHNIGEDTSAVHSSAHVNTAPTVKEDNIASDGETEDGTSSTKEESGLASYLGAGAWVADTVSQLSDAIPPLKLTMDILKVILENASTMEENKNAATDLCSRIKRLLELVHHEGADPTKFHVVALTKSLTKINQGLVPIGVSTEGHQGLSARLKQFIFASGNKSRINDFVASVDRAILDYQVALTHKLYEIKLTEMDKDDRNTLNNMKPVSEAMFDASDTRTPCLPGTRVDILHTLEGWATDPTARQLYWLNGHAGSGKSTIAQSLAERLFAQGRLGASYFCSRNSQRASDLKTIFATIAFQLARALNERSAAYRKFLLKTIENQANPDVATYSLSEQLQRLILGPMAESGIETVVIIDALDECVDDKSTSAILDLLSQHATRIPELKVKFFITSRPESHIRSGFRLTPLEELTDVMVIHEVASPSINQDIQLFLEYKFKHIVTTRSDIDTSQVWPTKEEVDALVTTSAGLFIFASTIIKFLDVRDEDPKARLREVFDFQDSESRAHPADTPADAYPFHELDSLYMQVLGRTSVNNDVKKERRKAILGVIVMAYAPVSITTIAGLLCLGNDEVRSLIRPLHSVLHVPSDDTTPLQLYHKSFADFLVDRHRCSDSQLLIIADDHHRSIALHCLELMKGGLKKNICGLSRYSMNSDLAPGKLDECVSSALRYCCQYWARHLTVDRHGGQRFPETQLEYLLTKQMLMWVEVLSLIGDLPSAVHSLIMLKEWLTTLQASDATRTLLDWVQDGHRLVLFAFDIIALSVPHIYHSALVFAPEQSLLKRAHAADLSAEARLLIGATTEWEGPLRTIDMEHNPATLDFSPDGSMLALGGRQGNCCIVHPTTGARICSFEAEFEKHGLPSTSWVTSVSFSANNQLLAMSFDESPFLVLLYDVHTGLTSAQRLDTDYNKLMVAFCPSSHHAPLLLISPRQERIGGNLQLYLWDTSSGTPGDSEGRPNCDRLSLNRVSAWCWLHGDQATPQIAVGLSDGSIEIRSFSPSQSPALLARSDSALFARHVVSMASSQDGTKIAAISADGELSLFTTQTHQSGTRQITHILLFPKELRLPHTLNERSTPPKLYFVQESHTLVIKEPAKLRAFRLDCSASQAGVEEIGLSILNSELHKSEAVAFSPDGQYIAYNRNIASLSTAIPSLLQHHRDSFRTVGAPKPERHYRICYCDGQVVITDEYIWDITKHQRRYSCVNEIEEMSSAFPVKDDIILSCNWRGDVTLWDPSREQPVIKRWGCVLNHRGRHPKLHVYSYTTSTIRFLSYPQLLGKNKPTDIKLWAITSTDTLSPPRESTAGDSGPHLHQIAAGQIPANRVIRFVYHEYLADSNREEAVFYLEVIKRTRYSRERYRGFRMWSAAQATVSEPLVEEDGSGPVHIEFEEIPCVWDDEYPIAGDGLFRMSEDKRWVLDSRRRKRLWLPPAYASKRPGETFDPGQLHCAHGSTFAIRGYSDMGEYLKTLVDFSGVRLDHSVPF